MRKVNKFQFIWNNKTIVCGREFAFRVYISITKNGYNSILWIIIFSVTSKIEAKKLKIKIFTILIVLPNLSFYCENSDLKCFQLILFQQFC